MITVYSKPSCSACIRAKKLLSKNGLEYIEISLVGTVMDEFKILHPSLKSVPQILINEKLVGLKELTKYLNEE